MKALNRRLGVVCHVHLGGHDWHTAHRHTLNLAMTLVAVARKTEPVFGIGQALQILLLSIGILVTGNAMGEVVTGGGPVSPRAPLALHSIL